MSSRYRERLIGNMSGTCQEDYYGSLITSNHSITPLIKKTCADVVGNRDGNNPLTIHSYEKEITPLSGTNVRNPAGYFTHFVNCPPTLSGATHYDSNMPDAPSTDSLATKAYARTNPSRAHVDIPIFVAELRELPALFKWAGKTLMKKGANAFLSYQYGWKPLINDIGNFLDFQQHVDNRVKELERLHSKSGLKRRVTLETQNAFKVYPNETLHSVFEYFTCKAESSHLRDIWATIHWTPDNPSLKPSAKDLKAQARRAVGGMTIDASTAWNLMPWSWLIDWGTSAGDYFEANRNIVGASAGQCCIMQHDRRTTRLVRTSGPSSISGGDTTLRWDTKSRVVVDSPSITADLPILSGTQWSILGALAIQRIR